jgi:hypothetical protein
LRRGAGFQAMGRISDLRWELQGLATSATGRHKKRPVMTNRPF